MFKALYGIMLNVDMHLYVSLPYLMSLVYGRGLFIK